MPILLFYAHKSHSSGLEETPPPNPTKFPIEFTQLVVIMVDDSKETHVGSNYSIPSYCNLTESVWSTTSILLGY